MILNIAKTLIKILIASILAGIRFHIDKNIYNHDTLMENIFVALEGFLAQVIFTIAVGGLIWCLAALLQKDSRNLNTFINIVDGVTTFMIIIFITSFFYE